MIVKDFLATVYIVTWLLKIFSRFNSLRLVGEAVYWITRTISRKIRALITDQFGLRRLQMCGLSDTWIANRKHLREVKSKAENYALKGIYRGPKIASKQSKGSNSQRMIRISKEIPQIISTTDWKKILPEICAKLISAQNGMTNDNTNFLVEVFTDGKINYTMPPSNSVNLRTNREKQNYNPNIQVNNNPPTRFGDEVLAQKF